MVLLAIYKDRSIVIRKPDCTSGLMENDNRTHAINPVTGKTACGLGGAQPTTKPEINCSDCRAEIAFRMRHPTSLEIGIPVRARPLPAADGKFHLRFK